jgi:hypothetical protein
MNRIPFLVLLGWAAIAGCGTPAEVGRAAATLPSVAERAPSMRLNPLNLLLIGSESLDRLDYDASLGLESCLRQNGWEFSVVRGNAPAQSVAERASAASQGRHYQRTGAKSLVEQTGDFYTAIDDPDDQTRFAHDLGGVDNGGTGAGCLEQAYQAVRSPWMLSPDAAATYSRFIAGALTDPALGEAERSYQSCMQRAGVERIDSALVAERVAQNKPGQAQLVQADDACLSSEFDTQVYDLSLKVLEKLVADSVLPAKAIPEILTKPN